jgi:hypothetical protein
MRPIQLALIHFTVCRMFLYSLTLCNSSFFILSVLPISIILQHHISRLSRYFWLCHIRSKTQNGWCRAFLVHLEFLLPKQTVSILDPRLPRIPNTYTNTTTTAFAPLTFWGTVAPYVPACNMFYVLLTYKSWFKWSLSKQAETNTKANETVVVTSLVTVSRQTCQVRQLASDTPVAGIFLAEVNCVWNMTSHAQKPDFVKC